MLGLDAAADEDGPGFVVASTCSLGLGLDSRVVDGEGLGFIDAWTKRSLGLGPDTAATDSNDDEDGLGGLTCGTSGVVIVADADAIVPMPATLIAYSRNQY